VNSIRLINHPHAHAHAHARVVAAAEVTVPAALLNPNCLPMSGSEDFSMMVNATTDQCGAQIFINLATA